MIKCYPEAESTFTFLSPVLELLVEEIHQFIQALQVEGRFDHAVGYWGRTKTRSVESTMNPCRRPTQLGYRNNVVKSVSYTHLTLPTSDLV